MTITMPKSQTILNKDLERHSAWMRCQNTERMRSELWERLDRQIAHGKLTHGEATQIRSEFWLEKANDQRISLGYHPIY